MKRGILLFALLLATATLWAGESNLEFVENKNQWDKDVHAKASIRGGNIWLMEGKIVYNYWNSDEIHHVHHMKADCSREDLREQIINAHAVFMEFKNSNTEATIQKYERNQGTINFFKGNDPSKWGKGCLGFKNIYYQNLYPGIDLKAYSQENNFKFDYIIKPGINPNQIVQVYEGHNTLKLRGENLVCLTSINKIIESKPYAYQIIDGKEIEIECAYQLNGNEVSYALGNYNPDYELVIDPTLIASVYSGISFEDIYGFTACTDFAGNIYSGGEAFGSSLPSTPGAYQGTFGGGWQDMALNKFNEDATVRIFSTYIGGGGDEYPHSIIADSDGNLIAMGGTDSNDFPVTASAFQNTSAGGGHDIGIVKLSADGTQLLGGTYVGGSGNDGMNSGNSYNYGDDHRGEVNVDPQDNIYIISNTNSTDFPVSGTAVQTTNAGNQDAVIFKMTPDLNAMLWGTYLGGSDNEGGFRIAIKENEEVIVVGGTASANFPVTAGVFQENFLGNTSGGFAINTDGFVTHLNDDGSLIIRSSFIGTDNYDQAYFVDLDFEENVYVMGQSEALFPTTPGVYFDANGELFIVRLNDDWSAIELATRLGSQAGGGGSGYGFANLISPTAFLVDVCDNLYVSGFGSWFSGDLPVVTPDAFASSAQGQDFHFQVVDEDAQNLVYGSYFGGSSSEHVDGGTSRFDKRGIIYQGMCTSSGDVPGAAGTASPSLNSFWDINAFKFDFEQVGLDAVAAAEPATEGCAPFTVDFQNLGFGGLTYEWDFGDGVGTSTDENPTYTFNDPGQYEVQLIATDPTSCLITDTSYTTIFVSTGQVEAEFTTQNTGDCDQLEVIFDNNTLFATDYEWDFGDGSPVSTEANPVHTYTTPGTYTVTLTATDNAGCNDPDTFTLEVEYTNDLQAEADFAFDPEPECTQMEVDFTNMSQFGDTYEWDFGDGSPVSNETDPTHIYTDEGSYTVTLTVSDSQGCADPDVITYVVDYTFDPGSMTASFTTIEDNECEELDVDFNNTSPSGDTFQWDFGDGNGSNVENPSHTYTSPGSYTATLTVSDSQGCLEPAVYSQEINYEGPVEAVLNIPDVEGCVNSTVQFTTDTNAPYYEWDFGDGNTSTLQNPEHLYESSGTFNVSLTVIDSSTCNISSQATIPVDIAGPPDATFIVSDTIVDLNEEIEFILENPDQIETFEWTFGDGSSDNNNLQPIHFYNQQGYVDICIDIVSPQGCPDQHCQRILVLTESAIGVPNAFSPNGDQENDILFVKGFNIETFDFKLFNRFGELVFETEDLTQGWDGIYRGQEHEMDVFVYLLNARLTDGTTISNMTGNVTLLR